LFVLPGAGLAKCRRSVIGPDGAHWLLLEGRQCLGTDVSQFPENGLEVFLLAPEICQALTYLIQQQHQLIMLGWVGVVQIQVISDLSQAEAQPLTAQDDL
jgi:hypothetical protein